MRRPSRRLLAILMAGQLAPLLAGCFPMGLACPLLLRTPDVQAAPRPEEVHAFRVEVDDERWVRLGPPFGCDLSHFRLRVVPLSPEGTVPAQRALSLVLFWAADVSEGWNESSRDLVLRLYRPGYQTVDVQRGQKGGPIAWREAPSLDDQERAVDQLVLIPDSEAHGNLCSWCVPRSGQFPTLARDGEAPVRLPWAGLLWDEDWHPQEARALFPGLLGGPASGPDGQALLFAAEEYERLARLAGQRCVLDEQPAWPAMLASEPHLGEAWGPLSRRSAFRQNRLLGKAAALRWFVR